MSSPGCLFVLLGPGSAPHRLLGTTRASLLAVLPQARRCEEHPWLLQIPLHPASGTPDRMVFSPAELQEPLEAITRALGEAVWQPPGTPERLLVAASILGGAHLERAPLATRLLEQQHLLRPGQVGLELAESVFAPVLISDRFGPLGPGRWRWLSSEERLIERRPRGEAASDRFVPTTLELSWARGLPPQAQPAHLHYAPVERDGRAGGSGASEPPGPQSQDQDRPLAAWCRGHRGDRLRLDLSVTALPSSTWLLLLEASPGSCAHEAGTAPQAPRWCSVELEWTSLARGSAAAWVMDDREKRVHPTLLQVVGAGFDSAGLTLLLEDLNSDLLAWTEWLRTAPGSVTGLCEGPAPDVASPDGPVLSGWLLAHRFRERLLHRKLPGPVEFHLQIFTSLELAGRYSPPDGPELETWRRLLEDGALDAFFSCLTESVVERLPPLIGREARLMLAVAHRRRGELHLAQQMLEALEQEARAAGCPHQAARALREQGRIQVDLGALEPAIHLLHRSIEALHALQDPIEAARTQLHLGQLFSRQDRFEDALHQFESILIPARQANDRELEAHALQGIGQSCHDLGREKEARRALRDGLDLFTLLRCDVGILRLLGDWSNLEFDYGFPRRALEHARAQVERARHHPHPGYRASALFNLGRSLGATGHLDEAITTLQEAWELVPGTHWDLRGMLCVALCDALVQRKQPEDALGWLERADTGISGVDLDSPGQEPIGRIELRWQLERVRARCLEALAGQYPAGSDPEQSALRRARAAMHAGLRWLERWRSSLTGPARPYAWEVAGRFLDDSVALVLRTATSSEELLLAVEGLRARASAEEFAALRGQAGTERRTDPLRSLEPTEPERLAALKDLQRRLPEHLVLLSFYCLPQQVVVCRLDRQVVRHRCLDVPAAELRALRDSLRELVELRPIPPDVLEILAQLSHRLLSPLLDWLPPLDGTRTLAVLEQGPIMHLPWQALLPTLPEEDPAGAPGPGPDGDVLSSTCPLGTRLGILRLPNLALWSAGSDALVHVRHAPPKRPADALFLGDSRGDLVFARAEARTLAAQVARGRCLLQGDVTWEQLVAQAPGAELIHLAVHARETSGGMALVLSSADSREKERLALAADLRRLELNGPLVVLSACASGCGELNRAAEDPHQLPLALLHAGAAAVLAAGWSIGDAGLDAFFATFYRGWQQGETAAWAFRRGLEVSWTASPDLLGWLAGPGAFILTAHPDRIEHDHG